MGPGVLGVGDRTTIPDMVDRTGAELVVAGVGVGVGVCVECGRTRGGFRFRGQRPW